MRVAVALLAILVWIDLAFLIWAFVVLHNMTQGLYDKLDKERPTV